MGPPERAHCDTGRTSVLCARARTHTHVRTHLQQAWHRESPGEPVISKGLAPCAASHLRCQPSPGAMAVGRRLRRQAGTEGERPRRYLREWGGGEADSRLGQLLRCCVAGRLAAARQHWSSHAHTLTAEGDWLRHRHGPWSRARRSSCARTVPTLMWVRGCCPNALRSVRLASCAASAGSLVRAPLVSARPL